MVTPTVTAISRASARGEPLTQPRRQRHWCAWAPYPAEKTGIRHETAMTRLRQQPITCLRSAQEPDKVSRRVWSPTNHRVMDAWAWSALDPWLADRVELPVGPLFCVVDGPTRGRAWSASAARTSFTTSR